MRPAAGEYSAGWCRVQMWVQDRARRELGRAFDGSGRWVVLKLFRLRLLHRRERTVRTRGFLYPRGWRECHGPMKGTHIFGFRRRKSADRAAHLLRWVEPEHTSTLPPLQPRNAGTRTILVRPGFSAIVVGQTEGEQKNGTEMQTSATEDAGSRRRRTCRKRGECGVPWSVFPRALRAKTRLAQSCAEGNEAAG
jgi:hypothetical protein